MFNVWACRGYHRISSSISIRKYQKQLYLTISQGRVWHVNIKQDKNGVFMKNGWIRFVNEKRLELGQVMVFRYNRRSTSFTVGIFGRNAIKNEDGDSKKPFNSVKKKEQESDADSSLIHKSKRNRRKPQKFTTKRNLRKPKNLMQIQSTWTSPQHNVKPFVRWKWYD